MPPTHLSFQIKTTRSLAKHIHQIHVVIFFLADGKFHRKQLIGQGSVEGEMPRRATSSWCYFRKTVLDEILE